MPRGRGSAKDKPISTPKDALEYFSMSLDIIRRLDADARDYLKNDRVGRSDEEDFADALKLLKELRPQITNGTMKEGVLKSFAQRGGSRAEADESWNEIEKTLSSAIIGNKAARAKASKLAKEQLAPLVALRDFMKDPENASIIYKCVEDDIERKKLEAEKEREAKREPYRQQRAKQLEAYNARIFEQQLAERKEAAERKAKKLNDLKAAADLAAAKEATAAAVGAASFAMGSKKRNVSCGASSSDAAQRARAEVEKAERIAMAHEHEKGLCDAEAVRIQQMVEMSEKCRIGDLIGRYTEGT